MLPFKKILCTTDFSEPSYEALKAANELALHFSSTLYLVHVVAPIPVFPVPTTTLSAGVASGLNIQLYQQELKANAEKKLEEVREQKVSRDLQIYASVTQGIAADEIVRIAEKEKVDLIVIATHGETGWRRFIFGSVAEKVVRLSPCPVLTIRAPSEGN